MDNMKLSLDQQIDLDVRSLGSSGEGVGTYEGFIVFVEGALPDERIRVSISEVKKKICAWKTSFCAAPFSQPRHTHLPHLRKMRGLPADAFELSNAVNN